MPRSFGGNTGFTANPLMGAQRPPGPTLFPGAPSVANVQGDAAMDPNLGNTPMLEGMLKASRSAIGGQQIMQGLSQQAQQGPDGAAKANFIAQQLGPQNQLVSPQVAQATAQQFAPSMLPGRGRPQQTNSPPIVQQRGMGQT